MADFQTVLCHSVGEAKILLFAYFIKTSAKCSGSGADRKLCRGHSISVRPKNGTFFFHFDRTGREDFHVSSFGIIFNQFEVFYVFQKWLRSKYTTLIFHYFSRQSLYARSVWISICPESYFVVYFVRKGGGGNFKNQKFGIYGSQNTYVYI